MRVVMRKWFKYRLVESKKKTVYEKIDCNFDDHQKAMGGYTVDKAYESKDALFREYYYGYHLGRLESYAHFLKKHLKKSDKILSIGSGRCLNEIRLLEEGYQVVCSDLVVSEAVLATKALFPSLEFTVLDITKNPTNVKYDKIIALSLIYLFDDEKLTRLFINVSQSLKDGGGLIIEIPGIPDNFMGNFFYHYYLKFELFILNLIRFVVKKSSQGTAIKHHGYLRGDEEIINFANNHGFGLVDKTEFGFLGDLYGRSISLQLLFKFAPFLAKPKFHARMLFFRKKINSGVMQAK
jgi:SAM-dependent methyltransferase